MKVVLRHGLVGQQVLLQLSHTVQLVGILLVVVDLLKKTIHLEGEREKERERDIDDD